MAHGNRVVKPLAYELREQVTIYFEEGLLTQGLDFLTSLLTSGVANGGVAYIPTPSHLSLISTLSVHPNFTNRAKDASLRRVSQLANLYLRHLNSLVSPLESQLIEAYTWPELTLTRRGGFSRRGPDNNAEYGQEGEGDANNGVRSPYARDRSLFHKSADFWAAVGWAFRCSVLHPTTRWPPWELWLEHTIETLERDLNDRIMPEDQVGSLIAKYVKGPERRVRILRAVFADSSDRFAHEFPEVWKNETKPPTVVKKEAEIKKIDVENEEFGDYLDMSTDEEQDQEGTAEDRMEVEAEASGRKMAGRDEPEATAQLGGQAAVKLRMRLLGLVIRLADSLPGHFGTIWTLYDSCLEYFKPLPVPAFGVVLSPQMLDPFPEEAAMALVKFLANSLAQLAARTSKTADLTQEELIEGYLPHAASTNVFVDNAKLSICLEVLIRILDMQRKLRWSADLEMAVELGIEKRSTKATAARGKKGEARGERDSDLDKKALEDSAMRLRLLVHLSKIASESSHQ